MSQQLFGLFDCGVMVLSSEARLGRVLAARPDISRPSHLSASLSCTHADPAGAAFRPRVHCDMEPRGQLIERVFDDHTVSEAAGGRGRIGLQATDAAMT